MAWTTPGTATAGQVLTASYWNTQVRDNLIELQPFALAWTTFTPTFGNTTLGNGTVSGAYVKVGKTVHVTASFTLGTTSAVSGAIALNLPFTARVAYAGNFTALAADSGVAGYVLAAQQISTTQVVAYAINAAGTYATVTNTSATIPFTWGSTDFIWIAGTYEAA